VEMWRAQQANDVFEDEEVKLVLIVKSLEQTRVRSQQVRPRVTRVLVDIAGGEGLARRTSDNTNRPVRTGRLSPEPQYGRRSGLRQVNDTSYYTSVAAVVIVGLNGGRIVV